MHRDVRLFLHLRNTAAIVILSSVNNAMITMSKLIPLVFASLVLLAGLSAASAADLAEGKKAAAQCNVCHGSNGLATNPEAPNLAGESAIYIEKQLVAFKTGERQHRQMSIIASGLDIDTIKALSQWYEAMIVTVEVPEVE